MSALHRTVAAGLTYLQAYARANGFGLTVTSTRRSRAQQRRLYADYLAGRHPYPVAPPGRSAHELGLAFDAVAEPRSRQEELGRLWERMGGTWGGRFRDPVHFEVR